METALYYGFSTIAQTLAAAIALLGALVLFRLQALASAMKEPATLLTGEFHVDGEGAAELRRLLVAENYSAIEAHFRCGRYKAQAEVNVAARNASDTLTRLVGLRTDLLVALRRALWWTASVIAGSVIVIFAVPAFGTSGPVVIVVMLAGAVALLVCLGIYATIVKRVAQV